MRYMLDYTGGWDTFMRYMLDYTGGYLYEVYAGLHRGITL